VSLGATFAVDAVVYALALGVCVMVVARRREESRA
jgi:hypothetical protein